MITHEIELEGGWVVIHHNPTAPMKVAYEVYLIRHRCRGRLNITEQRGHGISPTKIAGQTFCPRCDNDAPDEVIGFFNLCKWGIHHDEQ